ncbi:hypothetical protein PYCCODRAFT_1036392 [Trametes coccinea BRFM310]|uniref:Uncharacterized protein n=1 Tax=Trametes coccinea (strain BRFM310) TaxID=1353009 RepID=A0A1Y2IAL0_TRAC3|nr:hypothetical protein PYCCODRAFT_1036392 [Trametes coccinea BRFM310]
MPSHPTAAPNNVYTQRNTRGHRPFVTPGDLLSPQRCLSRPLFRAVSSWPSRLAAADGISPSTDTATDSSRRRRRIPLNARRCSQTRTALDGPLPVRANNLTSTIVSAGTDHPRRLAHSARTYSRRQRAPRAPLWLPTPVALKRSWCRRLRLARYYSRH